jgi:hypothetical protein
MCTVGIIDMIPTDVTRYGGIEYAPVSADRHQPPLVFYVVISDYVSTRAFVGTAWGQRLTPFVGPNQEGGGAAVYFGLFFLGYRLYDFG